MKKTKLLLILFALLAFGQMAWAQSIVSVNYVDENGVTQPVNAISLDEIAQVNPNGATIGTSGFTNCYVVQGSNVVMNGQLGYYGGINLILCDGAKLTINTTDESAIQSQTGNNQLTIYVQANGTGQLIVNASNNNGLTTEYLTINGGVISVTSGGTGIHADDNLIINRGTVTVNSDGNAMYGYNVTINGGNVSATSTGNAGIANGATGTIILGYTTNNDRIYASSYQVGYTASLRVKDGQYFITDDGQFVYGGYNKDYVGFLAGRTLSPFIPTEWSGGGDSASDPYIIASVYDLNLLSLRARAGEDYTGKYFRLDANIAFTHSTDWNDPSNPESNFTAISAFDGHFNGNSHTISGLRLHTNYNFTEQKGLFDRLGPNAYIENLTISNARIAGEKQVGAVAGYAQEGATVTNCHVTGTVTVHAYGHTLENHGGIVGANYGTVSNCVSEATITRSFIANDYGKTGGIAGTNSGTLSGNKVFNVNITVAENYGAIAGLNDGGTLTNNYYRACTINGTANATSVGCNGADVTASDGALSLHTISTPNTITIVTTPTLTYNAVNYWAQSKPVTLSGGLDGQPEPGCQKAYYINSVALQENSTTIKNNFDMPATDVTITIGEIHADWAITPNNPSAGSTSDNPYKIYFTDQMNLLATRVNDGTSTYSGKYFKLMDDLTYDNTEQNNYIAIGTGSNPFSGHFDGNRMAVEGIRIYTNSGYQGVFGYIVDAEVKDLYVNDIMISGHDRVGSIVGECDGSSTITNCRVTTATLIATGVSSSQQLFGGIAGRNSGTSTMSNNFVLGINIPQIYHFGAIAGENGGSLVSNYYHNYIMNGTAYPTGMGCNGGDVGGAEPVFTVSVPDGVTATATATVTYNEANYYKEGVTVTLDGGLDGSNPNPGCQNAYVVYGQTLTGSNLAPGHEFDMQNANAVVTIGSMIADWATEQGAGDTEGNPYKIYYKEQLDLLATRVNAGESYSGKYFKLMDDLTYDNTQQNNYIAIGTSTHPFSGHFDGNQKTIEGIRIYGTGSYQGVFGYIVNAEVKDLYVNDIEITAHDRVGCIVGECDGSTTITNCRVTTATLSASGELLYCPLFGGIAGRNSGMSTMSNNFVLGLNIPQVYHFGAIAGENGGSSLVSNYYHNCTAVGSTAYPTGIGCNGQDVEGAKPVFTLSVATGITANATVTLTHNEVNYYKLGTTVSLSYVTQPAPGYEHIYSVYGSSIDGDSFNMVADANVSVVPDLLIDWAIKYSGADEEHAYLISNVEQWNMFANRVNGTNGETATSYNDKFFKLMEDISVTTMVGGGDGSACVFSGTFDGDGHTITFNVDNTSDQYTAPFRRIDGATVKGIRLNGNVTSSNRFAGGIVAYAKGTSTVTNCVNSTAITSNGANDNASNGAIVGMVGGNGTVNITGCVFNGKMTGVTNSDNTWSGILGLCNSGCTANINDCLVDPVSAVEHGNTVYRNSGTTHCSNCYYTKTIGNAQGLKARSIAGGTDITVSFAGDADVYNVSGITAYTSGNANLIGLKYDNTLYAGKNETVSINLEFTGNLPAHHVPVYTVSNATLSGTENPYTLNMGNSDNAAVVISCENSIVAWEGHGTETDPYLIYTNGQWDLLATNVDNGNNYSGTFFKLMDDISVTTMVGASSTGSSYKSFNGTFDGNGHTLNVTYSGSGDCTAPFTCISGATIKNLHVTGTIATTKMRPASIASFVADNSTIENCWSEVAISSSHNSDIDAGGFVARVDKNKSVTLNGCLFTGSITYSDNNGYQGGGMVGWTQDGAYATLNNCYFAPSSVSFVKDSDLEMYMFIGGKRNHVTLTNCYYNDVAAAQTKLTPEDKRAYSITGGSGVSVENAGNPTPYNVSGITSYGTGIKYNNVLYAGNGDNVSLNLEYSAGSGYTLSGFVATAGTLVGSSNPYTLEMPDANVTITVTTTVAEWEGTGDDWDHAYLIYNKEQFNLLASRVNAGNDYSNKYFKLMVNLTYTGTDSNYTVIGNSSSRKFNGHFDGQGFTLSGIRTNYDQNVAKGLFGYLGSSGEVKNIVFSNSRISNGRPSGAIVGNNEGTVTGCHVTSDVTLFGTYNTAYILGGIVGTNQSTGTISQCSFAGTVKRNHEDFSNNNYEYGGIVGGNYGTVTDNFVCGATIYAVPANYDQLVNGLNTGCGAIFGHQHTGTIARNYYTACTIVTDEKVWIDQFNSYYVSIENATGVGSGGYTDFYDLNNINNYPDGAVPGNARTISGYGSSEETGWAFIASPFTDNTAPTSVENLFSASEYDLYRLEPSNSMWENYKQTGDHYHFSLENGRGYLYATQEQETVKFIGATTSAYNLNDTEDVTLGEGFNLVGNPFPRAAYINKSYYKLNAIGSAIVAEPVSSATFISPCNGVIIQGTANEVVTFSTTAPGSVGAAANNGNLNIALAQTTVTRSGADNKTIDNAIVSFNEGSELGKFYFGHQDANIYIPQGRVDYAIAFSDKHGEMPLNFKATENGSYTLTVNLEDVDMAYLHLIDNLTGNDVDLLVDPSYTFSGQISDYASRFKLVFVANDAQIGAEGSEDFAFISNGQLIVTGITDNSVLQIIDITGRVLSSCNASNHINIDGLTPGIYVLRLIDGDNVRTQKIVVK